MNELYEMVIDLNNMVFGVLLVDKLLIFFRYIFFWYRVLVKLDFGYDIIENLSIVSVIIFL